LENEGYGRLVLLPKGEFDVFSFAESVAGIDALRFVVVGEVLVERRSGGVDALSTLREGREDLWRVLSLDLGVSGSRSRSFSRGLEGIAVDVRRE